MAMSSSEYIYDLGIACGCEQGMTNRLFCEGDRIPSNQTLQANECDNLSFALFLLPRLTSLNVGGREWQEIQTSDHF